jgi:hypothetical protein
VSSASAIIVANTRLFLRRSDVWLVNRSLSFTPDDLPRLFFLLRELPSTPSVSVHNRHTAILPQISLVKAGQSA